MIQTINNWVNEEERKTLVDFILSNDEKNKKLGPDQLLSTSQPGELRSSTYMLKDSLTDRWKEFNFLSEPIVNKILAPKFFSLVGESYVTLWANIFRRGEGIKLHNHGTVKLSGNLYIGGPEDSATHYAGRKPVHNKIGTLTIFDAQLDHWVEINKTGIPRVSMAFDVRDSMPNRANELSPHTFIPLGTHVN